MSSIRRTLLVWLLAGLALIALVATGATYLAARREVGELLDLQLKQLAYSTRIDDLLRGRRPGFEPHAQPSGAGITELVTQIWDRDGVLVYWSQPGMGLPVPATEGYSTANHDGRRWRVYTLVQGTHALQVEYTRPEARMPRLRLSWQRLPGGDLEVVHAQPDVLRSVLDALVVLCGAAAFGVWVWQKRAWLALLPRLMTRKLAAT